MSKPQSKKNRIKRIIKIFKRDLDHTTSLSEHPNCRKLLNCFIFGIFTHAKHTAKPFGNFSKAKQTIIEDYINENQELLANSNSTLPTIQSYEDRVEKLHKEVQESNAKLSATVSAPQKCEVLMSGDHTLTFEEFEKMTKHINTKAGFEVIALRKVASNGSNLPAGSSGAPDNNLVFSTDDD